MHLHKTHDGHIKPEQHRRPWTNEERSKLLDLYFAGRAIKTIAVQLNRRINSIESEVWKIATDYRDQGSYKNIFTYEPHSSLVWTTREDEFLLKCQGNIPSHYIANIMNRSDEDVLGRLKWLKNKGHPTMMEFLNG